MIKTHLVLAAMLASGCATLFSSGTTTVAVASRQADVPITVDGMPAGHAPGMVVVTSHAPHVIASQTASCAVTTSVGAGWILLDLVAGFVPLIVDAATGAWKSVDATPCML